MSQRLAYQKMFATGRVVNLGCGDVPVDFGPDTVQVDMDKYDYPNFVQADIHNLPFKDNEFDTAVLGDVLEHSYDPVKCLQESARVAKKLVATVFEEWRHDGLSIEGKIKASEDELHALGHPDIQHQYASLPVFQDHCKEIVGDTDKPHHYHIQNFTDESLKEIVDKTGLEVIIFKKYLELVVDGRPAYNWLLVLQKPEAK